MSDIRTMNSLEAKLGGLIENMVVPGVVEKFNEKGFQFDSVSTNVKLSKEESIGAITYAHQRCEQAY